MLRRLQSREEIVEQRVVNSAALGVILDRQSEWIFAQPYLLDHVIMRRPCLAARPSAGFRGTLGRGPAFSKSIRKIEGHSPSEWSILTD